LMSQPRRVTIIDLSSPPRGGGFTLLKPVTPKGTDHAAACARPPRPPSVPLLPHAANLPNLKGAFRPSPPSPARFCPPRSKLQPVPPCASNATSSMKPGALRGSGLAASPGAWLRLLIEGGGSSADLPLVSGRRPRRTHSLAPGYKNKNRTTQARWFRGGQVGPARRKGTERDVKTLRSASLVWQTSGRRAVPKATPSLPRSAAPLFFARLAWAGVEQRDPLQFINQQTPSSRPVYYSEHTRASRNHARTGHSRRASCEPKPGNVPPPLDSWRPSPCRKQG